MFGKVLVYCHHNLHHVLILLSEEADVTNYCKSCAHWELLMWLSVSHARFTFTIILQFMLFYYCKNLLLQTKCINHKPFWMQHNSCEVLFIAACVLHALFMSFLPSFLIQLRQSLTSAPPFSLIRVYISVLTVADGALRVIVVHALTYDPPLGEDRVGTDSIYIEAAPGTH